MKAMRSFGWVTIVMAVMALAGAAAAQEVHTDHDKGANFERYHTYYWEQVKTSNPLWEQRIEEAVDKDLQAKGWQRVDSGANADVAIMAVGSSQNEQEYNTFYNGLHPWYWRGWGPAETTTTVTNYKVGTLVLDMYDAQSKHLIWRGTASDTLSSKPEKNEHHLDESVDKMFKDFPPRSR